MASGTRVLQELLKGIPADGLGDLVLEKYEVEVMDEESREGLEIGKS